MARCKYITACAPQYPHTPQTFSSIGVARSDGSKTATTRSSKRAHCRHSIHALISAGTSSLMLSIVRALVRLLKSVFAWSATWTLL